MVLGLWNGFLVSVLGIQPIIATLVLMTAGRGMAMLITEGQIVTVNNDVFRQVGAGFVVLPIAILISLAMLAAVALLTRRTALGMLIEAVGVNPEASRLAGVRSRTIIWTVYVFCGAVRRRRRADDRVERQRGGRQQRGPVDRDGRDPRGRHRRHVARRAAGTRSTGTLVGALVIQTLTTTVYTIGVPPETTLVFKAAVVIVVCLLQAPRLTGHCCARPGHSTVRRAGRRQVPGDRALRARLPSRFLPVHRDVRGVRADLRRGVDPLRGVRVRRRSSRTCSSTTRSSSSSRSA